MGLLPWPEPCTLLELPGPPCNILLTWFISLMVCSPEFPELQGTLAARGVHSYVLSDSAAFGTTRGNIKTACVKNLSSFPHRFTCNTLSLRLSERQLPHT